MWTLEGNANKPGTIHYLPCGSSLMVSRKDGHVLLQDDNSISRQHASITITHTTSNLKETTALPVVKLRDLGAKYGTYINDGIQQDLKIEGEQTLVDDDRVRFGMLTNTWRLKYHPLVVTTSALQPSSKVELQSALVKLGGHLILEWTASCSYLVMNTISLTVKVVCALAATRRIVTPEFFSKLVDAVEKRTSHPDASQYLPPLEEVSINQSLADFSPKEERKEALSGLNFIFPSLKQLKRMGPTVKLAGGTATLITEENARLVTSTNYLLVQLPDKNRDPVMSGLFVSAKEILKRNGLRVIPESDIGLAILYVSTENHCNPSFRVSNILKRNGSASTQSDEKTDMGVQIYATETQDGDDNSMSLTGTRLVPESVASSSRRTSATLPGTSFPVSGGSGIPVTLTNSSSTSTNASMLAPPESPLPRKSDPEDKANVLQSTTRKRLRTVSNEFAKPQAKRSSKPINGEAHPSVPEPTQPMEVQDEEEEDQLAESKFEPEHFSTQTNNTSVKKTVVNDIGNPSNRRQVKSLSTHNISNNVENTRDNGDVSLEQPTIGRSIPFEPYTLPSLNVESRDEDEVSTQPFADVKEEPASLPVDEPDCHSGKRRREEELNVQNEEDPSGWFVTKKNRTTNINNTQVKAERSCLKDCTSAANPQNIKQEQHEDDPFSLPIISGRSRRAEAKRKMAAAEECNANAADVDPFSVPSSSRAERGRKLLKTEDGNSRIISNRESVNEPPITTQQQTHPHITPSDERRCTSKNETWISKKSEGSVAAPAAVTTKAEPRYGDVADLSGDFEKSLVVVEVASLVRRREKMVAAIDTQNTSFGNLKNFKKFRKSGSDIMSLPKIIGGKDLVPHDVVTVRREDWFRENPDVTMLYEEREAQERSNDNELDALFDLPVNPRSRARMRR